MAKVPIERVKEVFSYLITEAEFLIETEIIEKSKHLTMEEKMPIYIESISKALGIKTLEEMEDLLSVFYAHNKNAQEEVNKGSEDESSEVEGEEKQVEQNLKVQSLNIETDCVLDYLKDFYEKKKNRNKEQCI